jgi:hypothetical protein
MSASSNTASNTRSNVNVHALFKRKLMEFIDDLHPVLNHLPQFVFGRTILRELDDVRNQEMFDAHVASKYEDQIIASDEQFFVGACPYNGLEGYMDVVGLIKGVWSGLTDADKSAVWAHLKVLVVLNRRCKGL